MIYQIYIIYLHYHYNNYVANVDRPRSIINRFSGVTKTSGELIKIIVSAHQPCHSDNIVSNEL